MLAPLRPAAPSRSCAPPLASALRTLVVLAVALLCGWPGALSAQTIQAITDVAVTREHEDDDRPAGKPYYYISREDCLASDVLTFDLQVFNPDPAYTFQVWASDGENCTTDDERSIERGECWLVHESTIGATRVDVQIPVQNIAAAQRPRSTGGGVSVGDANACSNDIDVGITLYFMHVSGGAVRGNNTTWQTKLDLKGPAAPFDVSAGIGDQRLVVSWDTELGDKSGYQIYCEESTTPLSEISGRREFSGFGQDHAALNLGGAGLGGTGFGGSGLGGSGLGGASAGATVGTGGTAAGNGSVMVPSSPTGATGGSGGTTATPTAICATSLVEGELPPADARLCGEVDIPSGERGTATGLTNSVVYAVAVSAVDELGNPGPLSNVDCEAPEDLDEFFEAYRRVGGQGGGGFCRLATPRSGIAWNWLFALGLALGVLGWRRR